MNKGYSTSKYTDFLGLNKNILLNKNLTQLQYESFVRFDVFRYIVVFVVEGKGRPALSAAAKAVD